MSGISSMMFSNFAPQVGSVDPFTTILLRMEGANGSTTITNTVTSGIAFTKGTNPLTYIQSAVTRFGTGAFFCNSPNNTGPGNEAGIYPTTKSLVNGSWIPRDYWLSNNFTAESWVYVRSNNASGKFSIWWGIGTPRFNAGFWNTHANASFDIEMSTNGTYTAATGGGAGYYYFKWSLGTGFVDAWHHVALVRNGVGLKLFIDGVDQGLATFTSGTGRTSADIFTAGDPYVGLGGSVSGNLAIADIGGPFTDYGFRRSYLDEFRFGNGIARYDANFTPISTAFPYPQP